MPTMPSDYYNRHDPSKNYETILYRDGYTLQGAELNEEQSAAAHRLKGIADALFKDGDLVRDASLKVDKATGAVLAASGAVYIKGAVRNVPAAQFTIPVIGSVAVGVRLKETVISELEDKSLYNPAIGSRGEGEPGAWRLKVEALWGFDGDGGDGEFYPVYAVDDGELRAKEAPPTLDSFTQGIAKYDCDSTAGGSYVVSGFTVLSAADSADGSQVYTVAAGRARINGYGVDLATDRRLIYAALPDLRRIDTEVHVADATSTQAGGQRLLVAHTPIHVIEAVRITTRKQSSIVHGTYSGCADALPDTAIVSLVEIKQGNTVYVQGTDYKKTGDTIDWSPSGGEPATGSTYQCIYDCITTVSPLKPDADGFSVEGAVENSSILITYQQALPRLDRLALTQDGQFQWLTGVSSERNARAPSVPGNLLPLATVYQNWRGSSAGGTQVQTDGVRVVPFSEISAINQRIDYVLQEVARQRLESDVFTRESGARVGLFVDPLLNDDMRDQGLAQTAAIVGGWLTLPIAATVDTLPQDVTLPTALEYTAAVMLEQPLRTGNMKVNPYMAFEVMPARVTLTPAVDYWTETQSQWASPVTQRFFSTVTQGWGNTLVGSNTNSSSQSWTSQVGSNRKALEYLRPIVVTFAAEGFGPGEELRSVTFDGIPVTFTPA